MSWRKYALHWLAWLPYVAVFTFTAIAGVLVLIQAIRDAPVFVIGGLIFVAWLLWGGLYINRSMRDDL